jgi:hypothetical protein
MRMMRETATQKGMSLFVSRYSKNQHDKKKKKNMKTERKEEKKEKEKRKEKK